MEGHKMINYTNEQLKKLLADEQVKYENFVKQGLALDMSRGKPSPDQLSLSRDMNDIEYDPKQSKMEYRNYGILDGIPEIKEMFAKILDVEKEEVLVGGNSSLTMMYDAVQRAMQFGVYGAKTPWGKQEKIKFLCPVPGYDRHFAITELFGFEMICVPMTKTGPDMDMIEKLVESDSSIKGIWCVPKYSNPDGVTYSDETVKRFANLSPKADDFRIFWDNAYFAHEVYGNDDQLLNLLNEAKKVGKEDMVYMFTSTSKITYAGAGVAFLVMSKANMEYNKKLLGIQAIGPDKLNQWRHVAYIKDANGLKEHMKKHQELLRPRFDVVTDKLEELKKDGFIRYEKPRGGYFVSVFTMDGTASEVVKLCKEAGVVFTPAGSTYPYKKDPNNSNIRLAPSYPPVSELKIAIDVFATCVMIATIKKQLGM